MLPKCDQCLNNMGLLQLKLSMFLLISAVCFKISVQSPTCGNNTFFIQYPFKLLQEGQKPHHITPYDLRCNGQGVVVLSLPFSGEFHVRHIDYFHQKIQLYDPSNCLPRRLKNLNLSSSPFAAVSYQKYTFFSCPLESPSSHNLTVVRCLSNSKALVVAAQETSMMDGIKNLTACKVMYSLQVPVSQVFEYVYNGIDGDLLLAWNDPSSKRNSTGKTSSKPAALFILICAIIISIALLGVLFCLGYCRSAVVVMLDIEEANYQSFWSCSGTRMWERARIRLSRASGGAAGPLNEVCFMSSGSQQPQSSSPRRAVSPLDESLSTPPPPSVAAVHPSGYYLSLMPSPPQVPRGFPAPPDELPSTPLSPNVAADALHGFVSFMSSLEVSSMPEADDGEVVIDAAPPGEDLSLAQAPGGAVAPLDVSASTPPPPSIAAVHPFGHFPSFVASPQGPRGAEAPLDELPSTLSSPSVFADAVDGFVSDMPSPEVRSMLAAHDDGFFIDDSSVISSTQVPREIAAPLDETPSTLPRPPPPLPLFLPPPPPPSNYFSLLSAHFGRRNAASLEELSSTPSSSVADNFSVIPSPVVPGIDGDALEVHDDEFSFHEELPTEDVIIGGSEFIFGPNGDSCSICLEKYKASEMLRLIRKCNHCFHADCLERWLHRKNTCPICRTNVIWTHF